jgi:dihydrofolate reductase
MRKVVAHELVSLDGVAPRPDEFFTEFDDVMRQNLGRDVAIPDAVVLGRRTSDDGADFWPTSEIEPFARFINGVAKFVVTSTRPRRDWANTTVLGGDPTEHLGERKRRPGGDIGVHASIALTPALLDGGLVDEARLVIAPVAHGRGRTLLDGADPRRRELTRPVASPSGPLLVGHRVGA